MKNIYSIGSDHINTKCSFKSMRFIIIFLFSLLFFACKQNAEDIQKAHDSIVTARYTCSMHPQVVTDKPGTCPICGMDLIKINQSDTSQNALMLSNTQLRLGNINTEKVSKRLVGQSIVINGSFAVDENETKVISSRVAGRIEKLYIKETGQPVKKGQPLYTIYSEKLLTLQQEYLLAKEQFIALGKTEEHYRSIFNAARSKLMLYGLTSEQISQLRDRDSLQPNFTFLAPASGIVTDLNASEGEYIAEGGVLYKIENVEKLWVEAELYPNETEFVKIGDKVIVVSGQEDKRIEAKVTFMSPEYRAKTQIVLMRASVNNQKLEFKPGQQVEVHLTHSSKETLAVPTDAIIRDDSGALVYLQVGHNTFKPRMVKIGIENFDFVEITDGLDEDDTVAISGAYLLYAEMVLKKGVDPMQTHAH